MSDGVNHRGISKKPTKAGRITLAEHWQPGLNGMKGSSWTSKLCWAGSRLSGKHVLRFTDGMDGGTWGDRTKSPEGAAKSHVDLFSGSKTQSRNCQHGPNFMGPIMKPSFFPLEKDCPPTGVCRMWRVCWGEADNLPLWLQRPEDGRNYPQGASPRG